MRKYAVSSSKTTLRLLGIVATIVLLLFFGAALSSQDSTTAQDKSKNNDVPILDYGNESLRAKSDEQIKAGAGFNGRIGSPTPSRQIIELPRGIEPLPTNNHWWVDVPALPVAESDTIIVGTVTGSQAHFSDDRTGMYSEFSVAVNELVKDTSGLVKPNTTVSVNREGGGVRFPSGKIQVYRIHRMGYPTTGGRCVLFLRREEAGYFTILTGYQLSNGRVTPIDGEDNPDPAAALGFSKYRGAVESEFLSEVMKAVQQGGGDSK